MSDHLDYIKITGSAVDRWDRRKERGALKEVTERELRAAVERSSGRIAQAMKTLLERYRGRVSPPRTEGDGK